ncbi:MAG: class I SAM-dependent methyltransferase [Bacilli bacterium]
MSHYYQNDPDLKEHLQMIDYQFKSCKLHFITNSGVFSRQQIDFGTHVLLETIKDMSVDNEMILDVGCGYGAIGLSMAKAYPNAFVEMIDVVTRAVELSILNAKENNITNVKIYESNLFENVNNMFSLIVSNPPVRAGKKIVHSIVDQASLKLKDNGKLLFVIQKKQGASSLQIKMNDVFGNVEVMNKKNGYFILKSVKIG